MLKLWFALVAALLLAIAPAPAATCQSKGQVSRAITFPRHDANDVAFARSMVPVLLPELYDTVPSALSCARVTVRTARGDYAIGGENGDAFPRLALPVDGQAGPIVYLAASSEAPGVLALVVRNRSLTTVKRFYAGIPTDELLAGDVRTALGDADGIIVYDADRTLVSYGFAPPVGGVPPQEPGRSVAAAGPQVFIAGSGDPRLLNMRDMRHAPSGFGCPQSFPGLAVLLMSVDPRPDYLSCGYRAGTDLRLRDDAEIRYQITLIKAAAGETSRRIFDELTASARASLRIKGDHVPPLPTGPAPAPEFVAYWDTKDGGVQGVWVGKASGWVVWLRAQYPHSATNDAEAGRIAQLLFAEAARMK